MDGLGLAPNFNRKSRLPRWQRRHPHRQQPIQAFFSSPKSSGVEMETGTGTGTLLRTRLHLGGRGVNGDGGKGGATSPKPKIFDGWEYGDHRRCYNRDGWRDGGIPLPLQRANHNLLGTTKKSDSPSTVTFSTSPPTSTLNPATLGPRWTINWQPWPVHAP